MYIMRILLFLIFCSSAFSSISLGVDVFFEENRFEKFAGKKIALAVNHTSVDKKMQSTLSLFLKHAKVAALFSPEHGVDGKAYAAENVKHSEVQGIPVFSLHGTTRRPTPEMLKGIDVIVYDIQCTGSRAYTYPTMLFYIMEEAAKVGIKVVVLDRPNPISGKIVDGPMLEEKWRSYIGYVNVPYCHGMTIGELSSFFNKEYQIGCKLEVVPMKGWQRQMSYRDTGLSWIPPSPNIPESDTPIYSLMTGILGELQVVNIGIGYTMPFKLVGAPWIQAAPFAEKLNSQKLPGIHFHPFHYRPFYGSYKGVDCEGVLIQITDLQKVKPLAVQYLILGLLKSMYPTQFLEKMSASAKNLFCLANGTHVIYDILTQEKYPAWKLIEYQKSEREQFLETREKYLLY